MNQSIWQGFRGVTQHLGAKVQETMEKLFPRIVLLIVGILVCQSHAYGQVTTADVVGAVADTTGAMVPGATVKIENLGTHAIRSSVTGGDGSYTFTQLQPGSYSVTISASAFKSFVVNQVDLIAGDRKRVDASLQPGTATETIEVTSTPSALQTDSTSVGTSLAGKSVQDLPLNGRNVYSLVQIAPGVTAGYPNSQAAGTRPADRRQSSSVSANGQDEHGNNNMIDGMDNNERMKGLILLRPSIDAIDQVSVSTNLNTAEVTRSPGAAIDIFSKSGTNTFHGTAYEFFRNDVFDARNYFAKGSKPELRQNQFGGSVGGPIFKDRTFFFVDIEKLRTIDATTAATYFTVPTLYEQQNPGDLSDIGGTATPIANIDPTALAYFKLYPAPNTPGTVTSSGTIINNYFADPASRGDTTTGDMRLDEHFTQNDQLFLRYSYNSVTQAVPNPFPPVNGVYPAGGAAGAFPANALITTHSSELAYTHIFSPRLVGSLHGGYTLFTNNTLPWNFGKNLNDSGQPYAIPNANNCISCSGLAQVTPATGYAVLGDATFIPLQLSEHVYQALGDLNFTPGKQSIKIGFSYINRLVGNIQHPNAKGSVTFPAATPQASLAKFFAGGPFTYTRQDVLTKLYERTYEYGMYLQDDWHILPNLTLNLGARYDIFTPAKELNGRYNNLDLTTFTLNQTPQGGLTTNYIDFGPRVGFAWTVIPKTVIRGGFGITFYPSDLGNGFMLLNPPYSYASGLVNYTTPISAGVASPIAPSTTTLKGAVTAKDMHWRDAYFEQFNLMVQRDVMGNTISVGYLGTMGKHLFEQISNWNLPPVSGSSIVPALRYKAQLPNVNTVLYFGDFGFSTYHALQASLNRRMSNGLAINASYTWAHSIDDYINQADGDTWGLQPDLISTRDRGNGALDVRHRVAFTVNYAIPAIHSDNILAKQALNHWQVNLLSYWQTGLPFTVQDSVTQGAQNLAYINLPTIKTDRPSLTGKPIFENSGGVHYFNQAAFTHQAVGTLGNVSRNSIFGPHLTRTDFSLFRTFPLHESLSAEFRAEAFNVMNTPVFNTPGITISAFNPDGSASNAGSFGTITSTAVGTTGRQIQFALKFLF